MYRETFDNLEKSFRPRDKYSHNFVIKQFSELVGKADQEIEYLKSQYDYQLQQTSELDLIIEKKELDIKKEKELTSALMTALVLFVPAAFILGKYAF